MSSIDPSESAENSERRFRVCQNCRLLTPALSPACVECGYKTFEAAAQEKESSFIRHFLSQPTPFTYIIFGVNALIFLLMIFCGGTINGVTLRAFGAKDNGLILNGEIWRFITPIFIHIGLIHMAFNSYALIAIGPTVEKLYGSARFVAIYLFAGVMGVAGSFAWSMFTGRAVIAAGASGAIFGLFGLLAVFSQRYKNELPQSFRRAFGGSILMTIIINLYIGFSLPSIDNAAHIGGLLAGAAAALAVPYRRPGENRKPSVWTALQIGCLLLITASFIQVIYRYDGPKFSFKVASWGVALGFGGGADVKGFVKSWNEGETAYLDSIKALKKGYDLNGRIDGDEILSVIDQGLLGLGRTPELDSKAGNYVGQLKELLAENKRLVEECRQGKLSEKDLIAQDEKFVRLEEDFCKWLETDGKIYGITCNSKKGE